MPQVTKGDEDVLKYEKDLREIDDLLTGKSPLHRQCSLLAINCQPKLNLSSL